MPLACTGYRVQCDGLVESDKSASLLDRKGKEVCIGYLLGTVQTGTIDGVLVENACGTWPKLVMPRPGRASQHVDRLAG